MSHLPGTDDNLNPWLQSAIDDLADDEPSVGCAVTGAAAQADDPKPVLRIPPERTIEATISTANTTYDALTAALIQKLAEDGVHPALCETTAYRIRMLWTAALGTVQR